MGRLNRLYERMRHVLHWLPIIWRDRDFDWAYLAEIMEFKLHNMADCIERNDSVLGVPRYVRQMRVCAELLHRLQHDDFRDGENFKKSEMRMNFYNDYLFTLMKKHMRLWWD